MKTYLDFSLPFLFILFGYFLPFMWNPAMLMIMKQSSPITYNTMLEDNWTKQTFHIIAAETKFSNTKKKETLSNFLTHIFSSNSALQSQRNVLLTFYIYSYYFSHIVAKISGRIYVRRGERHFGHQRDLTKKHKSIYGITQEIGDKRDSKEQEHHSIF